MSKPTTKRTGYGLFTACLFTAVLFVFLGTPRIAAATVPVRILGTIVPMQQANGLDDYVLQYKGRQWALQIDSVNVSFANPGGAETADGWALLNQMGRQRIVLVAPEKKMVKDLESPHILCKGVMIQGTLYPSTGRLALATVEQAPAKNLPTKCG